MVQLTNFSLEYAKTSAHLENFSPFRRFSLNTEETIFKLMPFPRTSHHRQCMMPITCMFKCLYKWIWKAMERCLQFKEIPQTLSNLKQDTRMLTCGTSCVNNVLHGGLKHATHRKNFKTRRYITACLEQVRTSTMVILMRSSQCKKGNNVFKMYGMSY